MILEQRPFLLVLLTLNMTNALADPDGQAKALKAHQKALNQSLEKIYQMHQPKATQVLKQVQRTWESQVIKDCDAVTHVWGGGSGSISASYDCYIDLTQQRTQFLNKHFIGE